MLRHYGNIQSRSVQLRMPWQGHLFIGQPFSTLEEGEAILKKLGIEVNQEYGLFESGAPRKIEYGLGTITVRIEAMEETEGGETERAVAFNLTNRYRGAVLDAEYPHGRDEPFIVDIDAVAYILKQVREWWPEAECLIWDRHY